MTARRSGLGLDLGDGAPVQHTIDSFSRDVVSGGVSSLSGDVAPNIAGGAASGGGEPTAAAGSTIGAGAGTTIAGAPSSDAPMSTTEKIAIGVGLAASIALVAVAVHFARKKNK